MAGPRRKHLGVKAAVIGALIGLVLNHFLPLPSILARLTKGTTRSVERCIERNTAALGDQNAVRTSCIERSQVLLSEEFVTGEAGYHWTEGHAYISGTLTNASSDFVITEVLLHFLHTKIQDGFEPVLLRNVWIVPGESRDFLDLELSFVPPEGAEEDVVWNVAVVRGVRQSGQ
jgi:hypothetical protein